MAASNIVNLTQDNFQSEVLQSQKPILVDFWAEWCGPCKMLAPVLDELAQDYDGKVRIGKVDIDQQQALAAQFGISAIPTLLLFKDGQVVNQMRGLRSKNDLKKNLDQVAQ
jgi:thioredoxin 1